MDLPAEHFKPSEPAVEQWASEPAVEQRAEKERADAKVIDFMAWVRKDEDVAERRVLDAIVRSKDAAKGREMTEELESISKEAEQAFGRERSRTRGLVRKWVTRAMVGLALTYGGIRLSEGEPEPQTIERIGEKAPKTPDVLLGHVAPSDLPGTIEFRGQEVSREDFTADLDQAISAGMKERYSGIADTCSGAEQCYLYYNDQMRFDANLISAATGKSKDELRFASRVLQDGFMLSSGMKLPGTVVGRVEAGLRLFPGAVMHEQRDEFYAETYHEYVAYLHETARAYRVHELPATERAEAAKILAGILKLETEARIIFMQAEHGYGNFGNRDVRKSLREVKLNEDSETSPVAPRLWRDAVRKRVELEKRLFTFLGEHSPAFKNVPAEEAEARAEIAALTVERDYAVRLQNTLVDAGLRDRADAWRGHISGIDARLALAHKDIEPKIAGLE